MSSVWKYWKVQYSGCLRHFNRMIQRNIFTKTHSVWVDTLPWLSLDLEPFLSILLPGGVTGSPFLIQCLTCTISDTGTCLPWPPLYRYCGIFSLIALSISVKSLLALHLFIIVTNSPRKRNKTSVPSCQTCASYWEKTAVESSMIKQVNNHSLQLSSTFLSQYGSSIQFVWVEILICRLHTLSVPIRKSQSSRWSIS